MVYVIKDQEESLLGKADAIALGIIKMDEKGDPPTEGIRRIVKTKKEQEKGAGEIVIGGETQEENGRNYREIPRAVQWIG